MNIEILSIKDARKIGIYNKLKRHIYAEISKLKYDIERHGETESNTKLLDQLEKIKKILEER